MDAKAHRGVWLLRIEDIDPYRSDPQAADAIPRTLERFGLQWDEAVIRQSARLERYREVLEQLDRQGWVYACTCSRKQLAELGYGGERYPNLCRHLERPRSQPHSLRLITEDRPIAFRDRLQGEYSLNLQREGGDFILYRRDQAYAYHLAVVVDDHDQQINHIVRGVDLLDSTPRHIHLQRLLGYTTPQYLHLPVILAADGQKLSKQTGAEPVDRLDPSATLFSLLGMLGHAPPAELRKAEPAVLLAWAVDAWDAGRLPATQGIPGTPPR
ncbi:glutamyl-Q tRNA(Asp) synthetase [Methylogaea oryzae]|uniref:Glutamyl-Q tRNA(Asp) synthetase n=1 Tax=Methylogaea oryzae TaxID=1295382 RepID=A0A8D4VPH6_9GAMM|nr:glutamyl-Q tRNA(Asp) synthetase [Methylogaea oryzae]